MLGIKHRELYIPSNEEMDISIPFTVREEGQETLKHVVP